MKIIRKFFLIINVKIIRLLENLDLFLPKGQKLTALAFNWLWVKTCSFLIEIKKILIFFVKTFFFLYEHENTQYYREKIVALIFKFFPKDDLHRFFEMTIFFVEIWSSFLLLFFYVRSDNYYYELTIKYMFILFLVYGLYHGYKLYIQIIVDPLELRYTIDLLLKEPLLTIYLLTRLYFLYFLFILKFYSSYAWLFWMTLTGTWVWEVGSCFFIYSLDHKSNLKFFNFIHIYFYYSFRISLVIEDMYDSPVILDAILRLSSDNQLHWIKTVVFKSQWIKKRGMESLYLTSYLFFLYHPLYIAGKINEESWANIWLAISG